MAEPVDCVVIGAGVVGLACARALAVSGRDVIVLERAEAIGTETSSRHSEVIHAGIYYEPGSMKARFCVAGKKKMYRFMQERGIPFNRLGKLIVATSEDQVPALRAIKMRAEQNGVLDLEFLTRADVAAREPALRCVTALWSPSTGVADSHSFMLGLQGDAEEHGAMVAFFAHVAEGRIEANGIVLDVDGEDSMSLKARTVVNARRPARSGCDQPNRRVSAGPNSTNVLLQGQLLRVVRLQGAVLEPDLSGTRTGWSRRSSHP